MDQNAEIYVTSAGETWDIIAYNLWGDELLMSELIKANRQYGHILQFDAAVELVVPAIEVAVTAETVPPWKR
jgi:hypothetical protein